MSHETREKGKKHKEKGAKSKKKNKKRGAKSKKPKFLYTKIKNFEIVGELPSM